MIDDAHHPPRPAAPAAGRADDAGSLGDEHGSHPGREAMPHNKQPA